MRWLVTGAEGMLGREVLEVLSTADAQVTAAGRRQLDITDAAAVRDAVAGFDVVVNCAAWTAVDDAETAEEAAYAINASGPAHLARSCAQAGAGLVHVSTDYVFSGDASQPYAEDAPKSPRSAYGRTKAAGEDAVRAELPDRSWILRTSWLYGKHGTNFVSTMLRLEAERPTIDVVNDQRGCPTAAADVARRIVAVAHTGAPAGIYHAVAGGDATWFDFAQEIFRLSGADPERVRPTTTAAFPRPAPRPRCSVLGQSGWQRAGLTPLDHWRPMLAGTLPSLRHASLSSS